MAFGVQPLHDTLDRPRPQGVNCLQMLENRACKDPCTESAFLAPTSPAPEAGSRGGARPSRSCGPPTARAGRTRVDRAGFRPDSRRPDTGTATTGRRDRVAVPTYAGLGGSCQHRERKAEQAEDGEHAGGVDRGTPPRRALGTGVAGSAQGGAGGHGETGAALVAVDLHGGWLRGLVTSVLPTRHSLVDPLQTVKVSASVIRKASAKKSLSRGCILADTVAA